MAATLSVVRLQSDPDVEGAITNAEFQQALANEASLERVAEGITQLCDIEVDEIDPIAFGYIDNGPSFGTVYPLLGKGPSKRSAIIVSTGFPQALYEHADMDRSQALELAADMANAYGVVTRAERQSFEPFRRQFGATQKPDLWQPEYAVGKSLISQPYRMAASIALKAQGLLRFGIVDDEQLPPYPPHIAALQNPLAKHEVKQATKFILTGLTAIDP